MPGGCTRFLEGSRGVGSWVLEWQIDIGLLVCRRNEVFDFNHRVFVRLDLRQVNLALVQILQSPKQVLFRLDPLHHCVLDLASLKQKLHLALSQLLHSVKHLLPLLGLKHDLVRKFVLLREDVLPLALNGLFLLFHFDKVAFERLPIQLNRLAFRLN